jgi:plastocyanin
MGRTKLLSIAAAVAVAAGACSGGAGAALQTEPRSGHGMMGIASPSPRGAAQAPGAEAGGGGSLFACHAASGGAPGYDGYGPGRLRRGGLAPEKLEPDAITLVGHPANYHGSRVVSSGGPMEMEMDNDYFSPTVLRGTPRSRLTIDLKNEGSRIHNFSIPGQHVDMNCGVRATGRVTVTFPQNGMLMFFCTYGRSSGMRGALSVG